MKRSAQSAVATAAAAAGAAGATAVTFPVPTGTFGHFLLLTFLSFIV